MQAIPTRARLLQALGESDAALTTREAADLLGLHRNGVRAQLVRLATDGLVVAERVVHGPGRPHDRWSLTDAGRLALAAPAAQADLATWLAEALAERPQGPGDAEATGRRVGRAMTTEGHVEAEARTELLRRLELAGFEPEVQPAPAGTLRVRLGRCTYRAAARRRADVVCRLHRGVTEGLLEGLAPQARLSAFEPRDPDCAGCMVEVLGLPE